MPPGDCQQAGATEQQLPRRIDRNAGKADPGRPERRLLPEHKRCPLRGLPSENKRQCEFSRVFRAETGLSPAKAIENLRLEVARFMLEQGRLPIEEIARETGFGDRERMRRSFHRTFGATPQALRNAAHPLAII